MPIVLYKKTEEFDKWQELEDNIAFKAKEIIETSSKSEMQEALAKVALLRKTAGLNPKTGEADDKKALPCFPPGGDVDVIGFIESKFEKKNIKKIFKIVGLDIEKIFGIEPNVTYQFVSWYALSLEIENAEKIFNKWCETQGDYEIIEYYHNETTPNTSDEEIQEAGNQLIKKNNQNYGPVFVDGLQVYGVFKGKSDVIYIAVENKKVTFIRKTIKKIKEMIEYVTSQKFPYDYIIKWEI